mgnify:FL=1
MGIWERFDDIATVDEVVEESYKVEPLEEGNYVMTLQEINAAESQNGAPMIKGVFRLDNNRPVYYNQLLQNLNYPSMTAKNIAEAVAFLSGLIGQDIKYEGLSKLEEVINGLESGILAEINVTYGKNDFDKKYPKLKVVKLMTDGDELF